MNLSETDIIERMARAARGDRADVMTGIGDDGAVLRPPPGVELVVVTDTLVEGVHFPAEAAPADLGYRCLAVNLSDLAAMGAEPAWATLSLALPAAGEGWIEAFAEGFSSLAGAHGVALVGGDTVRGPLAITVQLIGFVAPGAAVTRGGGSAGDRLFVTGTPGDAAAGLGVAGADAGARADAASLLARFWRPTPRVGIGVLLRGEATAAIDISDGLVVDAGRLAAASGLAVHLAVESLPLSGELLGWAGRDEARQLALTGGDDYELLFCLPADSVLDTGRLAAVGGCPVTAIGHLAAGAGVHCRVGEAPFEPRAPYAHFAADEK